MKVVIDIATILFFLSDLPNLISMNSWPFPYRRLSLKKCWKVDGPKLVIMAVKPTKSGSRTLDVGRGEEDSLSNALALGDVGGVGLQSVSQGKQKILSKREPAEQSANDGRRSAHLAGNVSWAPLPGPEITPRFLFSTPHQTPPPPEILISWLLAPKTYW